MERQDAGQEQPGNREPWPPEPIESLLGLELVEQTPSRTIVELTVTDAMLNGHGICHGGILFLLADAAMGRAANTASTALATHAEIDFLEAVPKGARLRARAVPRRRRGKMIIFDVAVAMVDEDEAELVVAEFRGRTLQVVKK